MNIYELIELANYEQQNLTDSLRKQIFESYDFDQWVQVGVVFLKGLDRRHQIPGKTIFVLTDMISLDQKHRPLTPKQKWFFVNTIIDNWDQMSCEARANLVI